MNVMLACSSSGWMIHCLLEHLPVRSWVTIPVGGGVVAEEETDRRPGLGALPLFITWRWQTLFLRGSPRSKGKAIHGLLPNVPDLLGEGVAGGGVWKFLLQYPPNLSVLGAGRSGGPGA